MKIYHNPRCSKSRQTLALINESGKPVKVIDYLNDPPTFDELKHLIGLLGITPLELIRKGETVYKEQFKGKTFSDDDWIKIMINNPKLIERPIVADGQKAILGRPPENVKSLL
jgi:arsenate reductase (glutaredoxin)